MKKIPYGISDYEKLITNDYYYIDKTMYLEKMENTKDTLTFLRPRRFGKTLLTSMMFYYYDINSKDKFDILFKDTYIGKNPTKNRNNYYVLKLDFSGMSTNKEENLEKRFNGCLYDGIKSFSYRYGFDYDINKELPPPELIRDFLSFFEVQGKKEKYT